MNDLSPASASALQRWQRMSLGVRLAFDTGRPCGIACYVSVGRKLVQHGLLQELDVEQRMFRLLLQSATDRALPAAWRRHCLSFANHPLTRLTTLLAADPFAVTRLHARWELAQQQLPTTSAGS